MPELVVQLPPRCRQKKSGIDIGHLPSYLSGPGAFDYLKANSSNVYLLGCWHNDKILTKCSTNEVKKYSSAYTFIKSRCMTATHEIMIEGDRNHNDDWFRKHAMVPVKDDLYRTRNLINQHLKTRPIYLDIRASPLFAKLNTNLLHLHADTEKKINQEFIQYQEKDRGRYQKTIKWFLHGKFFALLDDLVYKKEVYKKLQTSGDEIINTCSKKLFNRGGSHILNILYVSLCNQYKLAVDQFYADQKARYKTSEHIIKSGLSQLSKNHFSPIDMIQVSNICRERFAMIMDIMSIMHLCRSLQNNVKEIIMYAGEEHRQNLSRFCIEYVGMIRQFYITAKPIQNNKLLDCCLSLR